MVITIHILRILVIACYGVTTILYWKSFFSEEMTPKKGMKTFILLSLFLHGLLMVSIGLYHQRLPLGTWGEGLLFCAWLVGASHMLSEFFSKTSQIGVFTLLPTTLGVGIAVLFFEVGASLPKNYHGAFFSLHILASLSAFACFGISVIIATMYILLFKRLKRKQFDIYFRKLPPLEKLEHLTAVWTWIGCGLMLGATIIGLLWSHQAGRLGETWSHFIPLLLVLLAFFGSASLRQFFGFRGVRYIVTVMLAFSILFFVQYFSYSKF